MSYTDQDQLSQLDCNMNGVLHLCDGNMTKHNAVLLQYLLLIPT